ncbi:hypothetical protein SPRG_19590 [Saprolegnia parasitica CBS 223.65]|uniref:HIG1 domain-containing protein n=1 Tax=Saprolegnia parasitica (strain CBS 223.65) TaxID=695850 RepID=A0A067CKK2_SAPPC|nr:hypothetical protein SPRG_19590 [Saprolegnia parasitica CBS 223.65]KDO31063.1 hypothetical protein SPRG_19590 [Saprolegnia parasitica CBS 223.65]|eukprot:XP_012198322.1 hypothetical protein SPRG_19590 [Saprolegnia parasitica CBS 223.65]
MATLSSIDKRDAIVHNSASRGLQAAVVAGVTAGALVALANQQSTWFRHRLGVSGKVGLAVMASVASFAIVAEQDLLRGVRNPDAYISEMHGEVALPTKTMTTSDLPLLQRTANFVYDYPFRTLVGATVPLIGCIFLDQNRNANIQFSQKIMHTRIYGQGASVVLLLSTMAFHDYMAKRGRFQ